MVAGPLKRADEVGLQQSFDLIILLLVFRRELFIRDGLGSGFLILSSRHCRREVSHRACQNVLSIETHRRAATGNTKSREVAGVLAVAKMASHAIFQYNVLAIDDTHNTWTNLIVKMTILRILGSSDDKEKIGVARP